MQSFVESNGQLILRWAFKLKIPNSAIKTNSIASVGSKSGLYCTTNLGQSGEVKYMSLMQLLLFS